MRKRLLELIYNKSFRYDSNCGFKLASGRMSDVYIDLKKTVLSAEGIGLVGKVVSEMISADDVKGVGGLTLGADPIAYASALVSGEKGKPLEVFIVRKEPKKHGTARWIEGNLAEGDPVVIIEDVVTTGGSTLKAIERAREAGLVIKKVLALVDREEGGKEAIEEVVDCPFEAVFTKTELLELRQGEEGGR